MSARQISAPLGSINRIAFGTTEPCALMSVMALASIAFAAAKLAALNSLQLKTVKSSGDPRVARNSYFQTLADLLASNFAPRWLERFRLTSRYSWLHAQGSQGGSERPARPRYWDSMLSGRQQNCARRPFSRLAGIQRHAHGRLLPRRQIREPGQETSVAGVDQRLAFALSGHRHSLVRAAPRHGSARGRTSRRDPCP